MISSLIETLQEILDTQGDLPIYINCNPNEDIMLLLDIVTFDTSKVKGVLLTSHDHFKE